MLGGTAVSILSVLLKSPRTIFSGLGVSTLFWMSPALPNQL